MLGGPLGFIVRQERGDGRAGAGHRADKDVYKRQLFGLTIIASVGGKSQIKGLLMGFVGLLISCIGIDPMDGVSRFTFGINRMEGGIDTIPVLIGLFAITEIMACLLYTSSCFTSYVIVYI